VFKYKAKTRFRKKNGHRQDYIKLTVKDIVSPAAA
jgi:ribosomal protein L21